MLATQPPVEAYPVLKWVGGKAQLKGPILKEINRLHPAPIATYYEPFAGGLAIFFALFSAGRIERAVLSDSNEELINFYLQIQDEPNQLVAALSQLEKKGFGKKRYYEVRASKPTSDAGRAARFKYINACGYNGLWRVNRQNVCNVPYGWHKSPPKILDEEGIFAAHLAFKIANIVHADFRNICLDVRAVTAHGLGTAFLYLDPPYWPTRPTSNFTSYTAEEFGLKSQTDLWSEMTKFADLGVPALLSNSDVPGTRKLYAAFKKKRVSARRNVNSVGTGRGAVSELLIESNYRKKA